MSKYVSLVDVVKEHGVENIRVFFVTSKLNHAFGLVAFTSSSDDQTVVEGRIEVGGRYDVLNGYKFRAIPLEEGMSYEDFYNSDFESMSHKVPDSWYIMVGENRIPLHFVD